MEKPGAEFCEAAWGSIEPGGILYMRPGIWVHEEGSVTSTGVSDKGKVIFGGQKADFCLAERGSLW